jgi:hypothetical protein
VERGFGSPAQITESKKYYVEYEVFPIDNAKVLLMDQTERKEFIILIKRFGIWKIFDHGPDVGMDAYMHDPFDQLVQNMVQDWENSPARSE